MPHLPHDATDESLIAFADQWAQLMELEDYEAAFAFTEHIPEMKWTPTLMRDVVKAYGEAESTQRITLIGKPTAITQRKEVDRWAKNAHGAVGEIWYDLNIDGFVSI